MIKKIAVKLKSRRGISLSELLVALIFCLMTFALVCTAMQASLRELKRETRQSEAKILCSSLTMAVENELRFASDINGTDINDISFYSDRANSGNTRLMSENGHIVLKYKGESDSTMSLMLVPESAYTQGISAELSYLNYSESNEITGEKAKFDGEIVVRDSESNEISRQHFALEPLNSEIKSDQEDY